MLSLRFWMMFVGIGLVASIFELARPARKLKYWAYDALLLDVITLLVAMFFLQGVVMKCTHLIRVYLPIHPRPWHFLHRIRFPVRVALYYLLGDFTSYWMHRLSHTKYVWRVHHFHHSVTQLYWFAGVRQTAWQQTLSNLPYIFLAPLIFDARPTVYLQLMIIAIVADHWVHMNITWRSNWLEYIFVTPRSHSIHHSASPEHYNSNYGVVFSIWDRMFGTWIDPDTTVVTKIGAGTIENPAQAAWLMSGVFGTERNDFIRRNVRKLLPFL